MKINPHIMRGYDIRGDTTTDLNPQIAEHLGKAYGTYTIRELEEKNVVVSRDCRLTSPEFKDSFIRGLVSTGINVIDIGMTLVGRVYWAQYHFQTKASAMITASHNPAEYNGFKLSSDYSESLIFEKLQKVMDMAREEDFIVAETPGQVKKQDITENYFNNLLSRVNIDKKFKIVVDPSASTAGVIIPELLEKAGCEVIRKNCEVDGSFPLGVPDPTEETVARRLSEEVLQEKADLGFSYDADGDRVGIVDEKGAIIWNDILIAIFAIDVLSKNPGAAIMYNLLSSKMVKETIVKYGGKPFMWRVGHGFLKKKNQEIGAAFIGELSGHFFFTKDFYNHDDGAYATLRILNYLSRTNQTLSQALSSLPKYIMSPEIKIYCDDDKKVSLIDKIAPHLKNDYPGAEIVDDERAGDGLRLELVDASFVIRYSQNGPYITVRFEARAKERYEELKKYIRELLQKFPEVERNNQKIRVNINALL